MRKQYFISLGVFLFLILGTLIAVIYAKGYQIDFSKGKPEISGTGLLVVSSTPDGAQVFIDGHLTTATHNTLNLIPGVHDVQIVKDGYFAWEKKIKVQKEVVSTADAFLITKSPKLENITSTGISNPVVDPSYTRIAFTVASQSAKKNGIFVLNMQSSPILPLQSASTQVVDETNGILFSNAAISWSPDGQSLLATISANTTSPTTYQLDATQFNNTPKDVTETLTSVSNDWVKIQTQKDAAKLTGLKPALQKVLTDNFTILSWAEDKSKILYISSTSATLPQIIIPPVIGTDSTTEQRTLEKGATYVYDIKEDRNYKVLSTESTTMLHSIAWMPDSAHLLYVHDKRVEVIEYDALNRTTVFAGPFVDSFALPWPTGDKFVILTNLGNTDLTPNLYTVGLK